MVHKVIACTEDEVENPVGTLAVRSSGKIESVGDIPKAAWIDFVFTDDYRMAERRR